MEQKKDSSIRFNSFFQEWCQKGLKLVSPNVLENLNNSATFSAHWNWTPRGYYLTNLPLIQHWWIWILYIILNFNIVLNIFHSWLTVVIINIINSACHFSLKLGILIWIHSNQWKPQNSRQREFNCSEIYLKLALDFKVFIQCSLGIWYSTLSIHIQFQKITLKKIIEKSIYWKNHIFQFVGFSHKIFPNVWNSNIDSICNLIQYVRNRCFKITK